MSSLSSTKVLDEPLMPPPPGQVSNFANPPSSANAVYIAAGICLPLILLFAGLRFYAKFKILKKKTWDDFTCLLGLLGGATFICVTTAAVEGGKFGTHEWDIRVGELTKAQLVLSLIIEAVYAPFIWFIKLSLFVLYIEVFGLLQWLRYSAYTGVILTGCFYFATMVAIIVLCEPTNGMSQLAYASAQASPKCSQSYMVVLAQGIINVISDLYLIALPVPALWSLQMPLRRKLGVVAVISTGLIACIASILGLVFRINFIRSKDGTGKVVPVWIASFVEMTAGILVCCMPTANTVLKRIKNPLKSFVRPSSRGFTLIASRKAEPQHKSAESQPVP